ncbi:MAG: LptA/OstA family protein, partial [Bacillota bacterium]
MNFIDNAYIEYGTIKADADQIRVLEEENKAVLIGNVSGQQGENSFKADRIEIINNGDKIEMVGNAQVIFVEEQE